MSLSRITYNEEQIDTLLSKNSAVNCLKALALPVQCDEEPMGEQRDHFWHNWVQSLLQSLIMQYVVQSVH